jgi:hypothetical protein
MLEKLPAHGAFHIRKGTRLAMQHLREQSGLFPIDPCVETQTGREQTAQAIEGQVVVHFQPLAADQKQIERAVPVPPAQQRAAQIEQSVPRVVGSRGEQLLDDARRLLPPARRGRSGTDEGVVHEGNSMRLRLIRNRELWFCGWIDVLFPRAESTTSPPKLSVLP